MLVLLFYLGDVMYSIRCDKVREIAPMVNLKELPHAPDYFAGLFNYRGMIVPVIDLRRLIQKQSCDIRLSTRIILLDYDKPDGTPAIFGIMAERVTEAVMKSRDALISSGVTMTNMPYLGGLLVDDNTMIQYIAVEALPGVLNLSPPVEIGETTTMNRRRTD
jgi:chemotaxis-related protein WspB